MPNHNWSTGFTDSVDFYNHYLEKFHAEKFGNVIVDSAEPAESRSLMVIDMQNDFILNPVSPNKPGRFSVSDGETMAQPLADFIGANAQKFSKIIFSRDTHTSDHCSFFTKGGPFPPHCIANHDGAALHNSMKPFSTLPNADVIFKGCDHGTDSFSAVNYIKNGNTNKYANGRQLACKHEGATSWLSKTGSWYLNDKSKNFDDMPFVAPIADCGNVEKNPLLPADCPTATSEAIVKQLGEKFKIEHLLKEGQTSGSHNVFVVGLAGDWCVKDTAMNIMKYVKRNGGKLNGVTVRVYVIQPFVRFPMLPIQLNKVTADQYLDTSKEKDVNQYLFTLLPTLHLLTRGEVSEVQETVKTIMASGENPPPIYVSYLTGALPILEDYQKTGVKIVRNIPSFTTGGRRRKTRRSSKKSKKQRTRRHH